MKPTPNGNKCPKFLLKESRANLSSSITEKFKFKECGLILSRNFDRFKEILVQVNKTVYDSTQNRAKISIAGLKIAVP